MRLPEQRTLVWLGVTLGMFATLWFVAGWAWEKLSIAQVARLSEMSRKYGEIPEPVIAVSVTPARKMTLRRVGTFSGRTAPYYDVYAAARIQGWLLRYEDDPATKQPIDEGSYVSKGQTIARLDSAELSAKLAEREAELSYAESELKRYVRLLEEKGATRREHDLALRNRDLAKAAVDNLRVLLSYTEVRAPIDGHILKRAVDPGILLSPGAHLVRVADLSKLRVQVQVPEAEAQRLAVGGECTVRIPTVDDRRIPAKVTAVFPPLDKRTRMATVEVVLDNIRVAPPDAEPPRWLLSSDMIALVDLVLAESEDAVAIPLRSIIRQGEKPTVLVVQEVRLEGRTLRVANRKEVMLGIEQGEWVEVFTGVDEGDQVVDRGQLGIKDGDPVNIARLD